MRVSFGLCLLSGALCLGGASRVLAQETPAERMEEADQKVRELQEPAPEAVELEMTSPTTTEEKNPRTGVNERA